MTSRVGLAVPVPLQEVLDGGHLFGVGSQCSHTDHGAATMVLFAGVSVGGLSGRSPIRVTGKEKLSGQTATSTRRVVLDGGGTGSP